MRPSLRFLAIAVIGWGGMRAATLGALPGAELFRIERSEAKPPPIVATQFPPIDPVEPAMAEAPASVGTQHGYAYGYSEGPVPAQAARVVTAPVYYIPASLPLAEGPLRNVLPEPRPHFYAPIPALDEWPLSRIAASSMPPLRSSVVAPAQSVPAAIKPKGIDRLQLTAWALLRSQQAGVAGTRSLATGGSLGASQAGARLSYNFTPQISAVMRSSSDVGRRGGEAAGGIRIKPVRGIPVWLTAERRQRIGLYGGGRNAFAMFLEAGLYERPMPMHFLLDSYIQAGFVGIRSRDGFVDGGLTLTRPAYRQFSAGFGVWGGAQPGVYRVDAGPRITMRVRPNVKVHLDWRQRVAGKALPGSGPAITLAGDF